MAITYSHGQSLMCDMQFVVTARCRSKCGQSKAPTRSVPRLVVGGRFEGIVEVLGLGPVPLLYRCPLQRHGPEQLGPPELSSAAAAQATGKEGIAIAHAFLASGSRQASLFGLCGLAVKNVC